MREQMFSGTIASPGLGVGLALLTGTVSAAIDIKPGTSDDEKVLFDLAVQLSKTDLSQLIESLDETSANIIEFQLALLEDDDFLAPVIASIDAGMSAFSAWMSMMDAEVVDYDNASDPYMAARAEDYRDLQARIGRRITGGEPELTIASENSPVVILTDQITPSQILSLEVEKVAGIALTGGAPSSHASILARARGIPMLVGCDAEMLIGKDGDLVLIDASESRLYVNPSEDRHQTFTSKLDAQRIAERSMQNLVDHPAYTLDGVRIQLLANVDNPVLLDMANSQAFDGIGLTRTECIYQTKTLPTEDEQYDVYRKLLQWADGKPVTIRTLDAGGDKPISGVTIDGEANPFLGVRGYRLSQRRPGVFNVQLRALARSAIHGPMKVMIPMVTVPSEMREFRQRFQEVVLELESEGVACAVPQLGMMIEVPAAALCAREFDADFFSIGTNDLLQYTVAVARDNTQLSNLLKGAQTSVLRLIGLVVNDARNMSIDVSVCGDMASDPELVPHLLDLGVRDLSVAIAQVAQVKHIVRGWGKSTTQEKSDDRL